MLWGGRREVEDDAPDGDKTRAPTKDQAPKPRVKLKKTNRKCHQKLNFPLQCSGSWAGVVWNSAKIRTPSYLQELLQTVEHTKGSQLTQIRVQRSWFYLLRHLFLCPKLGPDKAQESIKSKILPQTLKYAVHYPSVPSRRDHCNCVSFSYLFGYVLGADLTWGAKMRQPYVIGKGGCKLSFFGPLRAILN